MRRQRTFPPAGGDTNVAVGARATVSGGGNNYAGGCGAATIGGGYYNNITATSGAPVIAGGSFNTMNGPDAVISGGKYNVANAQYSVVSGGLNDTITASGAYSVIPGGNNNKISGTYSFAFGNGVNVTDSYRAVFFDSTSPGRLGINIESPAYALDIDGICRADSFIGAFASGNDTSKTDDQTLQEVYNMNDNTVLMTAPHGDVVFFNDSGDTLLTLDESSGFIGIGSGTAAPYAALHVNGGVNDGLNEALRLGGGSTNEESGPAINFNQRFGDDSYPDWIIGQVGAVATNMAGYDGALVFYTNDGGGDVTLSEKLRITADGKVGIGTSSPAYDLHVVGNVGINGNLDLSAGTEILDSYGNPPDTAGMVLVSTDNSCAWMDAGEATHGEHCAHWYADPSGTPTVLYTGYNPSGKSCSKMFLGVAKGGAILTGANQETHVNLGGSGTAGASITGAVYSTISGGESNIVDAGYGSIGGGYLNTIEDSADYSHIGGGIENRIINGYGMGGSFIGGGAENLAEHGLSVVCGGMYDTAMTYCFVGGGENNTAGNVLDPMQFFYAVVGGGKDNAAVGCYSSILGGSGNKASAECAFVGGGSGNTANGYVSAVPGGSDNIVSGSHSFAFGKSVKVSSAYVAAFFTDSSGHYRGKLSVNNPNPHSALQVNGSFATVMLRASDDVDFSPSSSLDPEDYFTILADSGIAVTLPDAITCGGRIYAIRNISGDSVTVTVADSGSIENSDSLTVPAGEGIIVQAEGTTNDWWIIGDYNPDGE